MKMPTTNKLKPLEKISTRKKQKMKRKMFE